MLPRTKSLALAPWDKEYAATVVEPDDAARMRMSVHVQV